MNPIQLQIIQAAEKLGLKYHTEHNAGELPEIRISIAGRDIRFVDGIPVSEIPDEIAVITDNKHLTKAIFRELAIPFPEFMTFTDPVHSQSELSNFIQVYSPVVIKPVDGTDGEGVELNVKGYQQILKHFEKWSHAYPLFMLEQQVDGKDLRLQAVGGQLVAACTREPAHVTGDGSRTLAELIDERRMIIRHQNPLNVLEEDDAMRELLELQGLDWDDVPLKNQKVRLKYVSNMSQGGIATDVTDQIHPAYFQWIEKLCDRIGLGTLALDLIAQDFSIAPDKSNTAAIEINGRPFWLHHTFSEGRQHDIGYLILKDLVNAD